MSKLINEEMLNDNLWKIAKIDRDIDKIISNMNNKCSYKRNIAHIIDIDLLSNQKILENIFNNNIYKNNDILNTKILDNADDNTKINVYDNYINKNYKSSFIILNSLPEYIINDLSKNPFLKKFINIKYKKVSSDIIDCRIGNNLCYNLEPIMKILFTNAITKEYEKNKNREIYQLATLDYLISNQEKNNTNFIQSASSLFAELTYFDSYKINDLININRIDHTRANTLRKNILKSLLLKYDRDKFYCESLVLNTINFNDLLNCKDNYDVFEYVKENLIECGDIFVKYILKIFSSNTKEFLINNSMDIKVLLIKNFI